MSQWPSSVRGASGIHLDLFTDQPLGQGGEGVVFRTRYNGYAVKICGAVEDTPTDVQERLRRLRWLPLNGIPICRPLEPLAPPVVGYVMELLDDMVALRTICGPPDADLAHWYAEGGGLRRRLVLLARCAAVLAMLHDRGIVYSDVSPGNVLISAQQGYNEVWLVDADNLQTESSTMTRRLGTPFYTAPEVLRATTGNTVFSDVYSFAAMAYETLTTNHPLVGDYVADGPAEYEQDAERGLVPWIDHSADDRNRTSHGYPADRVLTRQLRRLFRHTLEEGMADPWARPGAGEWADALYAAADRCVLCPGCPHSYYAARQHCPWCGRERPPVLVIAVQEQFPRLGDLPTTVLPDHDLALALQPGRPLLVTARTVLRSAADPTAVLARLDWDGGDEVVVLNVGAAAMRRVPPVGGAGRQLQRGGSAAEPVQAPWTLHFGPDRQPHRMLTIEPPEPADVR